MCELMFVLTEVEGNTQYLKKLAISFGMPLTSDVLGVELFSLISSHDTAINLLKSVQIVLYTPSARQAVRVKSRRTLY